MVAARPASDIQPANDIQLLSVLGSTIAATLWFLVFIPTLILSYPRLGCVGACKDATRGNRRRFSDTTGNITLKLACCMAFSTSPVVAVVLY